MKYNIFEFLSQIHQLNNTFRCGNLEIFEILGTADVDIITVKKFKTIETIIKNI